MQFGEDEDGEPLTWEDVIPSPELNPEELMIRREEIEAAKKILANVIGAVNEREKDVLENRILSKDKTLAELAHKWNTTHPSIRRDVARLLAKLETSKEEYNNKLETSTSILVERINTPDVSES
jgi:DNA-directed RNA polymerase sigma subunit (sigma70/sigma32)